MNVDPHRFPNGTGAPVRVLPHNLDLESSILGAVIADPELLDSVRDLESDDFYHWPHRVIWDAIRSLEHDARPIDVVMVESEVEKAGKLEAIGGMAYLGELMLRHPTADNVVAYTADVRQLARNRKAIVALSAVLERAKDWPHDASELVSETIGELQRLDEQKSVRMDRDPKLTPPLIEFFGGDEPDENDDDDWNIRDIVPREPTLWGGRQKGGKTWAALDLSIALATGQPWLGFANTRGEPVRVLAVLIEDGKRRLKRRLWELCRGRGLSANDERLIENLSITREPIRLPEDMKALARRLQAWRPSVIFVDNLTRVMSGDPNSTRDASAFTKSWLQLGDDVGAAIVMLHHTRKPAGDPNRSGSIDPFDALRGSGDFGAAARHMIVAQPIEDSQTSRMYLRGNLDLRDDNFVLGFERRQGDDGRWLASLSNLGSVQKQIEAKKIAKDEDAKKKSLDEMQRRRLVALEIVRAKGSCSSRQLGAELGVSDRTAAVTLADLESDRVLVRSRQKGFILPIPLTPNPPQQVSIEVAS